MEEKRDFINLGGGRHCELPFDLVLVFSTNLNPLELADEAFLRRIGYKVQFGYLSPRNTNKSGARSANAWAFLMGPAVGALCLCSGCMQPEGMPLVPCHPRDLLNMALDRQRYLGGSGPLSPQELEWA